MTKAQETALLQRWLADAPPDSYLASMLHHLAPQFERDTRSDFYCLPDLHSIERAVLDARKELVAIQEAHESARINLAAAVSQRDTVRAQIDTLRDAARRIANA